MGHVVLCCFSFSLTNSTANLTNIGAGTRMEELQRKLASRRGHRGHLTKLINKMEEIMEGEIDTIRRATLDIHIGQLEQKRQKLSQLDTEVATLIDKPGDLEQEILESKEFQGTIVEEIC